MLAVTVVEFCVLEVQSACSVSWIAEQLPTVRRRRLDIGAQRVPMPPHYLEARIRPGFETAAAAALPSNEKESTSLSHGKPGVLGSAGRHAGN